MTIREHIVSVETEGNATTLIKQTRYGTFEATVHCNEEDLDIQNNWDGAIFAEYLCDLQSLHKQVTFMEQRAIGAMNVYKSLLQSKDENDEWMKLVKHHANIARRDADNLRETYKRMKKNYKVFTESRANMRREFIEIKNKRDSEAAAQN